MSDTDDSPILVRKKKVYRRVIDDDSTESEAELAPCTSEEDDETLDRDESQHVIVGDSSDDEEVIPESFVEPAETGGNVEANRSTGSEGRRSNKAAAAAASGDTTAEISFDEATNEAPPTVVTPEVANTSRPSSAAKKVTPPTGQAMKTSTPTTVGADGRQPARLDITAIPSSGLHYNMTVMGSASDESPDISPGIATSFRQHRYRQKTPGSSSDDVEDDLIANLDQITLQGAKDFAFKSKSNAMRREQGAAARDFFDDEADEDNDLSANFTFSGSNDSDDDVIPVHYTAQKKPVPEVLTIDDSEDDLQNLTAKFNKIPLGTKKPVEQPRKAIFLNEPPPIEKKTYSYDPTNARHQEFYGDVQRTVTKLAEIIENMPMPDDENKQEDIAPKGLVKLFDHQLYGLRWLSFREREFPYGGILADEMGLGKTIMVIALIMHSKQRLLTDDENWIDSDDIRNCIPSKTTLVVCPVGCIMQWNDEINSKGKGLRVYLHHGPQRTTSAAQLAQYDVVLSTYATIAAEIPKETSTKASRRSSPLERLYWRRVVLDEAHAIRNPKTVGAQAICKLKARHRWAVTGTPVHNRPEDFYSMVKFLRMNPFDDPKVWDFWIGMKSVKRQDAQQRLTIVGKSLILRRTKKEVEDAGGNVKKIPPKTIETVEVELSVEERKVYDYLSIFAKKMFNKFLENKENADGRVVELNRAASLFTTQGHKEMRQNKKNSSDDDLPQDIKFAQLFALLCRLRQCAVLPYLIHTMLEEEEIDEDVSFDEENAEHTISKINPIFDRMYLSTKFIRLLEDLETIRSEAIQEERSMDKVVIISSWTSTLDILYQHLRKRRFSSIFITGRENTQDRADNMKKFNNYPDKYHICLLSLMAGGVGLNLVGGNHVFFLEPHWNPQMELQAQDRCHRFGQTKNVVIRRYISKETVEQRVLELQENKLSLAESVISSAARKRGGGLSIPQLRALFTG